jgi:hypothetical protein
VNELIAKEIERKPTAENMARYYCYSIFSLLLLLFLHYLPIHGITTSITTDEEENSPTSSAYKSNNQMFNYQQIKTRSDHRFMKDKVSKEQLSLMLGIYEELHYRKEVLGIKKNNDDEGFFITNSTMLIDRLALAQQRHGRAPCSGKNKDVLLFGCLITKNDGPHLQVFAMDAPLRNFEKNYRVALALSLLCFCVA